jgi:hypothetical protein
MDSELTAIASVKALNQGVATGDSPTFAGLNASGDLTLDVAGDIILDADGGNVKFLDGGVVNLDIYKYNSNVYIENPTSNSDIIFSGNDGGSAITALTLDMSDGGTATFNSHVRLGDNKTASFGAGFDIEITSDGTNGTIGAPNGNLTLDVAGDIILDADGGDIILLDNGTGFGRFTNSSTDFVIKSDFQDRDMKFQGNDGGVGINALILDMSAAGAATFNAGATFGGTVLATNASSINAILRGGDGNSKNLIFQKQTGSAEQAKINAIGEDLTIYTGSTSVERASFNATEAVFNDSGTNTDFRVESDGNANMLFVDGENNRVGIGTASPSKTLHVDSDDVQAVAIFEASSGTFAELQLYDDAGTAQMTRLRNDAGLFSIFTGSSVQSLIISSTGVVTKPYQPAFQVKKNATQTDIAVGSAVTVTWQTEIFDLGSNFASNTFTAPVTGKYQLNAHLLIEAVDTASNYYQLILNTSNRLYYDTIDPGISDSDYAYQTVNSSVLADMDAGDTAIVTLVQATGTAQSDLNATTCVFSGYLVA